MAYSLHLLSLFHCSLLGVVILGAGKIVVQRRQLWSVIRRAHRRPQQGEPVILPRLWTLSLMPLARRGHHSSLYCPSSLVFHLYYGRTRSANSMNGPAIDDLLTGFVVSCDDHFPT